MEVDAYEVRRGAVAERLLHTAYSCEGVGEGVVVAYVADDDIVGVALRPLRGEEIAQLCYAVAGFGGEIYDGGAGFGGV